MDQISRRELLKFWRRKKAPGASTWPATSLGRVPAPRASVFARPATAVRTRAPSITALVRPPGALPEQEFLDVCTRCGDCVAACPVDAIQVVADGPTAGTPHIETRRSPCQLCAGLQCTHACPRGALAPVEDPRTVRMGTALIDTGQCLAYRGAPCRACFDVCPLPDVLKLVPGERTYVPVAGESPCVGCGLCHRYCPVPTAISIIPLADGIAQPVRIEPAVPVGGPAGA